MRGAIYVVYGENARREAIESIRSLRRILPDLPIQVVSDAEFDGERTALFPRRDAGARWSKLNLDKLSPFECMFYLDADTRVRADPSAGFEMIENGWELAIAYSGRQGPDVIGNVNRDERMATIEELGGIDFLGLQAGVMFVRWCQAMRRLWQCWREEWERYQGEDQAALLRALHRAPVKLALLGWPWNMPSMVNGQCVIEHHFGRAVG